MKSYLTAALILSLGSGPAFSESPPPAATAPTHAKAPAALPAPAKDGKPKISASNPTDVANTPAQDKKGTTPAEYKRPNRWGLTAGMSQRHDWLTGKNRFELHEHLNAKKV